MSNFVTWWGGGKKCIIQVSFFQKFHSRQLKLSGANRTFLKTFKTRKKILSAFGKFGENVFEVRCFKSRTAFKDLKVSYRKNLLIFGLRTRTKEICPASNIFRHEEEGGRMTGEEIPQF